MRPDLDRRRKSQNQACAGIQVNPGRMMRQPIFQNANYFPVAHAHQHALVFRRLDAAPFCCHRFRRERAARLACRRVVAPAANTIVTDFETFLVTFAFRLAPSERSDVVRIGERCRGDGVVLHLPMVLLRENLFHFIAERPIHRRPDRVIERLVRGRQRRPCLHIGFVDCDGVFEFLAELLGWHNFIFLRLLHFFRQRARR